MNFDFKIIALTVMVTLILSISTITVKADSRETEEVTRDTVTLPIIKDEQNLTREEVENAESLVRVREDNPRVLTINYSNTGREITRQLEWRTLPDWSFRVLEIDLYLGQELRSINRNQVGIKIFRNNNIRDRYVTSERLHICVNNTKLSREFNRYEVSSSDVCRSQSSSWTFYELPRLEYNEERILTFLEHPTPFIWWLGEGQGGIGNGVASCTYIFGYVSLNQTQTYVGDKVLLGFKVGRENTLSGCSVSRITGQQFNDLSQWRTIPTATTINTNLNCTGTDCYQDNPAWETWYYRTVTCTEFGNRTIRSLPTGLPTVYASGNLKIECINPPTPETSNIELPPKNKKEINLLFLSLIPIIAFVMIQKKHSKQKQK